MARGADRQCGTSIVELAMVVLIIALVVGLGIASLKNMLDTSRISSTRATLQEVKDCLVKRAVYSERFSSYANVDFCNNLSFDVNACFCLKRGVATDFWGNRVRFIGGLDDAGKSLNGLGMFNKDVAVGEGSRVVVDDGVSRDAVAFVLVSYGKDGKADNDSYGSLFTGDAVAADMNAVSPPDFSKRGHASDNPREGSSSVTAKATNSTAEYSRNATSGHRPATHPDAPLDDIYTVVTARELRALARE